MNVNGYVKRLVQPKIKARNISATCLFFFSIAPTTYQKFYDNYYLDIEWSYHFVLC